MKDKVAYKEDCFAFIKENVKDGCEILTECVCNNCSFYKIDEDYYTNMAVHDFNVEGNEK